MSGRVVQCLLCPKECRIAEGQAGDCRIRANIDGRLRALTFGLPVAVHVDPIEKKPFFHYHPGKRILSLATAGCNMHCRNCQNWEISQANPEDVEARPLPPRDVVDLARREGIPMVAYTYTEPLAYYEYAVETATIAKAAGLKSVIVTAGYANEAPVRALFRVVDAATVDVKAFDEAFYRDVCGGGLKPVLDTLVAAREEGAWLEVSNLVIPGMSDDRGRIRQLVRWVRDNLGADTPMHFLRFVPHYKLENLPPTPVETLDAAWRLAREEGLRYVYVGNVPGHESETTRCPGCGAVAIRRSGYRLLDLAVTDAGACKACGAAIAGRFGGME
jgi:pyruvate formate lyase activating enzyme